MVVLDSKGMLTAGNNQYLQPDYLSPLTSTLDSKKSPLALLAQTCSQIGADSSKPIPSSDKKKDEDKKEKSTPSPAETRRSPAFKPYESTTKKSCEETNGDDKPSGRSSGQATQRPSSASSNGGGSSSGTREDSGRRSSEAATSSCTTPIIRSGLEVLAGHPKDVPLGTYRPGMPSFLPPGYPGFETHPALRGAPPGLLSPGFIPGLAATLASSYPSAAAAALYSSAGLCVGGSIPASFLASPYITYTRVKTAGGGEAIVPVCRDPYCTGCAYSVQNNHLLQSGGACSPSCTQCEQAKTALSALPGLSSVPSSSLVPASSLLPTVSSVASLYSSPSPSMLAGNPPRPHVCNWTIGDSYCGKRFSTSEELLQHLRNHTSLSVADTSALSLLSNPLHAHAALLSSAHSALRPGASPYPPPALSPLTAARYHPYGKVHSALTTASVLTPALQGLSPYPLASAASAYAGFPPYSLYPRPM